MSDEIKADTEFEEVAEHDAIAVDFYTVHAIKTDGSRDERAEQIAHPYGFVPAELERAESVAKRCNQLNLIGVEFKAVKA